MNISRFYILLALLGLVLPWAQYMPFVQTHGVNLPLFISQVFANGPATGFALDVLWATLVFWIWSYFDARQNNVPHWWAALLAGACLGLSVALPLYLAIKTSQAPQRAAANAPAQ
ncbi:DUF2834 domain-containing protein [Maritalea porphyrae]|uniref:DUF2834 domain-containing protein n=1 Tax=Maritalea porphyrae TaxID=880732 RepID=A0ABQ5UNN3_9HYPH|nr:DUF2834 domain-containing protein [Maritalea porphyrae]GLQ16464.1 hypothetical protein GCM10007879_07130 [Maritalea porphyrae]